MEKLIELSGERQPFTPGRFILSLPHSLESAHDSTEKVGRIYATFPIVDEGFPVQFNEPLVLLHQLRWDAPVMRSFQMDMKALALVALRLSGASTAMLMPGPWRSLA